MKSNPPHYRSDQIGSDDHSLKILKREIRSYPRLTNEQLREALNNAQRDDAINGSAAHARWVAVHLRPRDLDEGEAVSIALITLVETVDALIAVGELPPDPRNYIKKAIQHAMTRAAFSESSPISLPYASNARRKTQKPHTALAFDAALRGRSLRLSDEIRDDDGTGTGETHDAWIPAESYWLPDGTRADTAFQPPDTSVLRDSDRQLVVALLGAAKPRLTADEATVIDLRFGLTTGIDLTLEEVAAEMQTSYSTARKISASAMQKLKAGMTTPQVQNLLESGLWKVRNGAKRGA